MSKNNDNKSTDLLVAKSFNSSNNNDSLDLLNKKNIALLTTTGASMAFLGFMFYRYKVASPSEFIIRTGLGIKDISITKKAFQWPFQKTFRMNIAPTTFPIEVDAMSNQRIPFRMPSVWTVGPKSDCEESLKKYASLLSEKGESGVQRTVEGVIQGETRVLTANIDLNDLFSNRDSFKQNVVDRINSIIGDFGLIVYNSNIAELKDLDDENKFFSEQKRRALQIVTQEARVDTSKALKDGNVGEQANITETRQKIAEMEKDAKTVEYQRDREVAESLKELEVAKALYDQETQIARVQASAKTDQTKWELLKEVELKRQEQELASLKASQYTRAIVDAEVRIKEAEGLSNAIRIKAEAERYAREQEAEADRFAKEQEAVGKRAMLEQEAIGTRAMLKAQADGLNDMINSAGGSIDLLNKYIMVRDGVLPELAQKQANAIQGLAPKINIWHTGGGDNSDKNFSGVVSDLFKTSMPLFEGIKDQTGYDFMKTLNINKDTFNKQFKDQNPKLISAK